MQRITEKMLESRVDFLNNLKGFKKDRAYSTIGSYIVDYAYGGVSLHQYTNKHGAIRDIFSSGHTPKRELFNKIEAYIAGIKSQ